MNRQEIFTKAYLGLASQGFIRAVDEDEQVCAYRTENGLKCAIGHCISDELYSSDLEGETPCPSYEKQFRHALGLTTQLTGEDLFFLSSLQDCHDSVDNPEEMKLNLEEFARGHSLEVPHV